jgi:hypothetical protein
MIILTAPAIIDRTDEVVTVPRPGGLGFEFLRAATWLTRGKHLSFHQLGHHQYSYLKWSSPMQHGDTLAGNYERLWSDVALKPPLTENRNRRRRAEMRVYSQSKLTFH